MAILLLSTACSRNYHTSQKTKPVIIPQEYNIDEMLGANSYNNSGDNPTSLYYSNPDFYNMKNNDKLTIIEGFKTYQQTSEWSCGPASALMVLYHFGIENYNEWDIALAMGSHTDSQIEGALPGTAVRFGDIGTSVEKMYDFFLAMENMQVVESSYNNLYLPSDLIAEGDHNFSPPEWGNLYPRFSYKSLYTSDNDNTSDNYVSDATESYFVRWLTSHLQENRPIMVEWANWGGHWQVIIGYDNMGTPGIGDDMLIFADPYDTSDHWQDGYYYYPLERWFYNWHDLRIAPKPYQLQPFIIVEPKRNP